MRHSAGEVSHWSYFLIDMDPVTGSNCEATLEKADPMKALMRAIRLFGQWTETNFRVSGYLCPLIIDSGRGTQAWIRLEDVWLPGPEMRSLARRVNGYWLKRLDEECGLYAGCRIDTSVSDLPRMMRCPGTFNLKTGQMARIAHWSNMVYRGLASRMTERVPSQVLVDPDPPVGVAAGQPWQMVFAHLTRMAQNYLTFGQEEPGRHKVMWHTSKKLQELGVTREEARKAIRHANKLRGKDEELPLDQVEHALNTAYGA